MALALSQFGNQDVALYASYLLTHYGCDRGIGVDAPQGVSNTGTSSGCAEARGRGEVWSAAVDYLEGLVRSGGGCVSSRLQLDNQSGEASARVGDGGVCCDDGGGDATCRSRHSGKKSVCGLLGASANITGGSGHVDVDNCIGKPGQTKFGSGRCDSGGERESKRLETDDCKGQSVAGGGGNVGSEDTSSGLGLGPNTLRNREKRQKRARAKRAKASGVPFWRRLSKPVEDFGGSDCGSEGRYVPGLSRSVRTVDTRTAEEIEAVRTLAIRRSAENKVAAAMSEHKLASLLDPDKTKTLRDLDAVRMQERINTTRAKSQASFKKCASPLESVGSAASAGEFALKQEIRKNVALKSENKNLEEQLDKLLKVATPSQLTMLANLELRYVPTEEEIMAMDEDVSPYYSVDDMEEEAAKYRLGGGTKRQVSSALPSTSELMASLREMDATGKYY